MVFDHDLFGDDAHIEQIAVEDLFAVTEAWVEAGMGIRYSLQYTIIAHLQHRIAVRLRECRCGGMRSM